MRTFDDMQPENDGLVDGSSNPNTSIDCLLQGTERNIQDVERDMFYFQTFVGAPAEISLGEKERKEMASQRATIGEAITYVGTALGLPLYTREVAKVVAMVPRQGVTFEEHTDRTMNALYDSLQRHPDSFSPQSFEGLAYATAPGMATHTYQPNEMLTHLVFIGITVARAVENGKAKEEAIALTGLRFKHDKYLSGALEGYGHHVHEASPSL